jgi:hypothetical protein
LAIIPEQRLTVTPLPTIFMLALTVLYSSVANGGVVDLPQTRGEIVVDGVLDETAWQDAAEVELIYETEPGENIPARVATLAYLVEDGANLYIGFAASDPDPSAIRAYLRDRDSAWDDDYVGIIIDTYNDGHRAVEFFATPLGRAVISARKTIPGMRFGTRRERSTTRAIRSKSKSP